MWPGLGSAGRYGNRPGAPQQVVQETSASHADNRVQPNQQHHPPRPVGPDGRFDLGCLLLQTVGQRLAAGSYPGSGGHVADQAEDVPQSLRAHGEHGDFQALQRRHGLTAVPFTGDQHQVWLQADHHFYARVDHPTYLGLGAGFGREVAEIGDPYDPVAQPQRKQRLGETWRQRHNPLWLVGNLNPAADVVREYPRRNARRQHYCHSAGH